MKCEWICKKGKNKGTECGRPTRQKDSDDRYICVSHLKFMTPVEVPTEAPAEQPTEEPQVQPRFLAPPEPVEPVEPVEPTVMEPITEELPEIELDITGEPTVLEDYEEPPTRRLTKEEYEEAHRQLDREVRRTRKREVRIPLNMGLYGY